MYVCDLICFGADRGLWSFTVMSRVGQNHIYTVCIRYFWQGNHQIYGHIRCVYIRFWPTLVMSCLEVIMVRPCECLIPVSMNTFFCAKRRAPKMNRLGIGGLERLLVWSSLLLLRLKAESWVLHDSYLMKPGAFKLSQQARQFYTFHLCRQLYTRASACFV